MAGRIILACLVIEIAAQPLAPQWSTFLGNNQRSGVAPVSLDASHLSQTWSVTLSALSCYSSPVFGAEDTAYFGSSDGTLTAVNATGSVLWRVVAADEFRGSAAVDSSGVVYAGSYDSSLYAVWPNGTLKWKASLGATIDTSVAIGNDGTIFVSTSTCLLTALHPTGAAAWQVCGSSGGSTPTLSLDGGVVYVTAAGNSTGGATYAFRVDGTLAWTFPAGGPPSPCVAADGTVVVAGGADAMLYSLNPDGTLKWKAAFVAPAQASPTAASGGTIFVTTTDGTVHALDNNGLPLWTFSVGTYAFGSVVVAGEFVLYNTDDALLVINMLGQKVTEYPLESLNLLPLSSPAVSSGGRVCVSACFKLVAFDPVPSTSPTSSSSSSSTSTSSPFASPAIIPASASPSTATIAGITAGSLAAVVIISVAVWRWRAGTFRTSGFVSEGTTLLG